MTRHPCAGRTKRSREVFEEIAIGNGDEHNPRTVDGLIAAGLVEEVGRRTLGRDAFGLITVPIYAVPTPIHMQWCKWCSEQQENEDV